jgi:hypothetical protein
MQVEVPPNFAGVHRFKPPRGNTLTKFGARKAKKGKGAMI